MKTTSQARDEIWALISKWRRDGEASPGPEEGPGALSKASGVSLSMLYKFKSKNRLGPDSVSALKPLLLGVDSDTWLAAMGVERDDDAAAGPTP